MRINNNIMAVDAQRNLSMTAMSLSKSVERLSSGLRINRAADDAAGLSISEKLRSQVKGLAQASRNAQDGISMIQTAEGALTEVHGMLQRMRELSIQGANDTLSTEDREAISLELTQLEDEITDIRGRTKFNGQELLTGNLSTQLDAGNSTADNVASYNSANGNGNTTSVTLTDLDVSGAEAGKTYTLAANGSSLTLSDGDVTQEIAINANMADGTAGNTQAFNFDKLGVSFTVNETAGAGTGATAANVATSLAALTAMTEAGSAAAQFQIGADQGQNVTVNFNEVAVGAGSLDISDELATFAADLDATSADALVAALDTAIEFVSEQRANLGAFQNRLEHTIANVGVAHENLLASESRIRDADMAQEMVSFTRSQILQQAGTSILGQANQVPQSVLSLLR
jgi:flagellin